MATSQSRAAWQKAKSDYKDQLSGIKFDLNLGPDLDKLAEMQNKARELIAKTKNKVPGALGLLNQQNLKMKEQAIKCRATCRAYTQKVDPVKNKDKTAHTAVVAVLKHISDLCDQFTK